MELMDVDNYDVYKDNLTMDALISQEGLQRRKQPSRRVSMCLGLLCAVLLAGNIGQYLYYKIFSHAASVNPTQASYIQGGQLQSSFEALTAERNQLETRLTNLTKENDLLQHSYSSLTTERDELKASFNNLTNERDQLQTRYNTLKQDSDQLQTNKDQLQTRCSSLQTEKHVLQTLFVTLRSNRDLLQSNYSSLKMNKDQLQRSYDTLSTSLTHIQTGYSSLQKEKELLQSSYNSMEREKKHFESLYTSSTEVVDDLQKKIDKVRGKPCQTGWSRFDISCYYVSAVQKNWTKSREDCIAMGADLVVIDSRDEQSFVNGMLNSGQNVWIGMTDSLTEGTWMWVDGSPITTTYWGEDQPNSYNGNQDCGEIVEKSYGVGEWNDDGCFGDQFFVCEQ